MDNLNSNQSSGACDVTPAELDNAGVTLRGNSETSIKFLKGMHPNDLWCLTAIDPETGKPQTATFNANSDGKASAWIEARNGKCNLYFGVNPVRGPMSKKAKATDVASLNFLHVDIDPRYGEPIDEERKRILELLTDKLPAGVPKPTAIVFSGGGYQAFWQLAVPLALDGTAETAEKAKLWNLGLEQLFACADSCHNIDRIMRLPGTINLPNAKKRENGRVSAMAVVIEADWSRVYPLPDFTPAAPTSPPSAPRCDNDNLADHVDPKTELVKFVDVHDLDKHTADGQPLDDRVKRIIQAGFDELGDKAGGKPKNDRSRWVFDVSCALVRRGVPDNIVLSVLLDRDFRISDHIYDQKVGARKYAIRQIERAKQRVVLADSDFELTEDHKKRVRSQHNIRVALAKLGVTIKLDVFRQRMVASGLDEGDVYVDDAVVRRLWLQTEREFGFLPSKDFYYEVLADTASTNSFHPVCDHFDALTWDGTPRIANWLTRYAGAADNPFVQAVSKIILVAAVRRVRSPGCKFDQMLILEGDQGAGKSSLVRALAIRDEWFADEAPLGGDGKQAIEMLVGKLIVEPAELKSLKNSDVENVKAFLSRQADRGREAYGRIVTEAPRQCIFIGTTNSERYLMDPTGNRRFWSIKVGHIDVDGLKRDLDQLWAEAAYWEAKEESIQLPEELWAVAAGEQVQRVVDDPYSGLLAEKLGSLQGKIVKNDVYKLLELPIGQRHTGHERRIHEAMRTLGWRSTKLRRDGAAPQGCFINCDDALAQWIDVRVDESRASWAEPRSVDAPRMKLL